ncbi:HPr-rel-A system PqqD family peptide chaperone [Candidatus Sumerlaeota bacterium]|nr:HPr-rel-A system PqqD family peptide chaperone [Candidatus Sumerlaeota bacterium]
MNPAAPWDVQEMGRETVVFHRITGEVHILNETAAAIWRALVEQNQTFEMILDDLKRQFPQVSVAHLADDLEDTVRQLQEKHLVDPKDPATELRSDV